MHVIIGGITTDTIIKKIDPENMTDADFTEAAELLRSGRLVAFPTETVYGLGGDAYDATASGRIYAAKGRPSDNPLIVHIADIAALEELAHDIPKEAYALAERFWPGPLTMILKKNPIVPKETTGGLSTVAIRMPSHPIARRLIQESGVYIAAPSANASGRPSTTKAAHVIEDLDGKIDMIIDGGSSEIGLESTIVDLAGDSVQILRPGFITIDQLREIIPDIQYDKAVIKREKDENIVAKAPGMKYKHYAPKGDLTIYEGSQERVIETIAALANEKASEGAAVGILTTAENREKYEKLLFFEYPSDAQAVTGRVIIEEVGSRADEASVAAGLFDALREFDHEEIELIYAESFDSGDLGQAIMNRLLKAAGYHIVSVD